jgi:hypothetical protein
MIAFLPLLAFVATVLAAPAAEGPVLTVPNIPGTGTQGGAAPAATSSAAATPNPALVTINSISYGGTGCPQGSVGSFISADRLTFVSSHTCSHQNTFLLSNYDHRNIRQIIAC